MVEFLQFTLSGVVFGMIYAAVALSLVLIWRGTRVLNYAQGGMAMLTTFVPRVGKVLLLVNGAYGQRAKSIYFQLSPYTPAKFHSLLQCRIFA